jgi:hypothetical protein
MTHILRHGGYVAFFLRFLVACFVYLSILIFYLVGTEVGEADI